MTKVTKPTPTQAEAEAKVGLVRQTQIKGGAVALPGSPTNTSLTLNRYTRPGQIPVTRPDLSQLPEVVRAAQATSAAIQRENERIYDSLSKADLVMALLDRDLSVRKLASENAALTVEIARVRLKAAKLSTRQANAVHKATEMFQHAGSAFLELVKKFDDEREKSLRGPEPTEADREQYRKQVAKSDDEIADEINAEGEGEETDELR